MSVYDLSYQDKALIAVNRISSSYPGGDFGFITNYTGADLIITPWEEKPNLGRIKLTTLRVKDGHITGDDRNIISMLEKAINELEREAYEYEELLD